MAEPPARMVWQGLARRAPPAGRQV